MENNVGEGSLEVWPQTAGADELIRNKDLLCRMIYVQSRTKSGRINERPCQQMEPSLAYMSECAPSASIHTLSMSVLYPHGDLYESNLQGWQPRLHWQGDSEKNCNYANNQEKK
ncbi:uncharacterized protein ACBT57_007135 isoform 1-T3 [Dama dama]